jgi:glycosyltransferase involved in cell wall biosynthesis
MCREYTEELEMTQSKALSGNINEQTIQEQKLSVPVRQISVVIITQDEEVRTANAIRSCLNFADEIVVVDGGSKDRTAQRSQELGCKVYVNPWPGYAKQRILGISKTTYQWVFLLDSDEVVSEELALAIQDWKHTPKLEADIFAVKRVNPFLDHWLDGQAEYMTRLYDKSLFKIANVLVHEGPVAGNARIIRLPGILWHDAWRSIDDLVLRLQKYTSLEARQAYLNGKKFSLARLILRPPARFFQRYVLQRTFKKGIAGFIYAIFWAYWEFLREVKLYEMYWKDAKSVEKLSETDAELSE